VYNWRVVHTNLEAFFFDTDELSRLGALRATEYQEASPYPHIVIDDFLPADVLDAVLEEFPGPDDDWWHRRVEETEVKLQSTTEDGMGPRTRQLLNQFNAAPMMEFLEALTGISGLIPDPHYIGGGLHQIEPGGYLKVHADFNKQNRLKLDRRLNLLLYLNKDWKDEYGGHFEMWDTEMNTCQRRVLPVFNRCVIFSTTSSSYHGHPEPLRCPPGTTRKSLALYYYTNGRPSKEVRSDHTTLFQRRPGEEWRVERSTTERIKPFVPPVLIDLMKSERSPLRRRRR